MQHITVLQNEAVEGLQVSPGDIVVDATLGSGGHSSAIIEAIAPDGHLIAFDADPSAIADNQPLTERTDVSVTLINNNFSELETSLEANGVNKVDGILADLGWRMEQFAGTAGAARGFSFNSNEPLLMTYGDPEAYLFTARDIVNEWDESSIADVIYGYGEERAARKIAKAIIDARQVAPIETAAQLAELVKGVVWSRGSKIHPATRTFQALRIAVNDELGVLTKLLTSAVECLSPGGRLAIITFHSIEDRLVKQTFRSFAHDHKGDVITKKPITPSAAELEANPRARSAKLRIFQTV